MSSGPAPDYRLVVSEAVRNQMRELHRGAIAQGRAAQVLSATRTIIARLASDPLEFGEPLKELRVLKLQLRIGVVRPVGVTYGVDLERKLVYVTAFHALEEAGS